MHINKALDFPLSVRISHYGCGDKYCVVTGTLIVMEANFEKEIQF